MKDNERDNKYVERPAKLSLYQDRIDYLKVISGFFMYNKIRNMYITKSIAKFRIILCPIDMNLCLSNMKALSDL